ncbi:hypothetical protein ADU80_00020 (plasmid) [Clostridium botulinum]|uniref:Uncharacterized protein n=1 Tax=Clostridium botulinum TaxID=1491 RepID=A0A9Q1UXN9_CLOBO|nr:hypothetical protein ADU78_07475 [Clostridium botulinum]KOA77661.1 hypothetical protein ADU77_07655 [Clostridium botulinum]KOA85082.1 hypothetical protein ADU74_10465 [Clostridium botulinum]KOA88194.1 hypothetical protein ADU80_00020 [Clostridium botulinum]KOA88793.1 hypothetical protein ADU75_02095 [Clostridium botulinum]
MGKCHSPSAIYYTITINYMKYIIITLILILIALSISKTKKDTKVLEKEVHELKKKANQD